MVIGVTLRWPFFHAFWPNQLENRPLERLGIGLGQTVERRGKLFFPARPPFSPDLGNRGKQLILRLFELLFPGLDWQNRSTSHGYLGFPCFPQPLLLLGCFFVLKINPLVRRRDGKPTSQTVALGPGLWKRGGPHALTHEAGLLPG